MIALIDHFSRLGRYHWWVVAVELFLIGLVVYWVVDFLEGTRGERLFRGVIFLLAAGVLVLNVLVERFPFERLALLYKVFLLGVLVVAVAAFQPEIRRALIRIGQPSFLSRSRQRASKVVEEVITAVMDLAAARRGAIIIIERRVALGEFIETGVRIDGEVTTELLRTIFFPNTPLHDMAVVIRGDRIVAASVELPLAEAGTVGNVELGSRHRAALGVSAGSDALAIVVSEETGIISVAENGQLERNLGESDLRKRLVGTIEQAAANVEKIAGEAQSEVAEADKQSGN